MKRIEMSQDTQQGLNKFNKDVPAYFGEEKGFVKQYIVAALLFLTIVPCIVWAIIDQSRIFYCVMVSFMALFGGFYYLLYTKRMKCVKQQILQGCISVEQLQQKNNFRKVGDVCDIFLSLTKGKHLSGFRLIDAREIEKVEEEEIEDSNA